MRPKVTTGKIKWPTAFLKAAKFKSIILSINNDPLLFGQKGIFGQAGAPQGELENFGVGLDLNGAGNKVVVGAQYTDFEGMDAAGSVRAYEISSVSIANIDLRNDAAGALASISAAIDQVSGQRATLGALQNRLEYTVSNLMNVAEFTTSARSRIEDADFAAESARLAKAQVLQQTGTAMLAQANAQPQLALSLIR